MKKVHFLIFYKVSLVNFISILLSNVKIFLHLGLPDPPEKVELADWDIDHMDLTWMFPKSDGGAPIKNYLVKYNSHDIIL